MKDERKVWHAGRARQEELDEIDRCELCRTMPELEKTCYASAYCHRQIRMEMWTTGEESEHGREGQPE